MKAKIGNIDLEIESEADLRMLLNTTQTKTKKDLIIPVYETIQKDIRGAKHWRKYERRKNKHFTKEENANIGKWYARGDSISKIAKALGRTYKQTYSRISYMRKQLIIK